MNKAKGANTRSLLILGGLLVATFALALVVFRDSGPGQIRAGLPPVTSNLTEPPSKPACEDLRPEPPATCLGDIAISFSCGCTAGTFGFGYVSGEVSAVLCTPYESNLQSQIGDSCESYCRFWACNQGDGPIGPPLTGSHVTWPTLECHPPGDINPTSPPS
jgi:hypothetical protein